MRQRTINSLTFYCSNNLITCILPWQGCQGLNSWRRRGERGGKGGEEGEEGEEEGKLRKPRSPKLYNIGRKTRIHQSKALYIQSICDKSQNKVSISQTPFPDRVHSYLQKAVHLGLME